MKKITAGMLAMAMLCMLLTACSGQKSAQNTLGGQASEQTSSEEMDEITHRLLADWYGYLIRCEYLYGDMRWALSYLEPFFEDHSWDSIQTARAAMSLAKRRAGAVGSLEAQMTFDDYDKLLQSDADLSSVQIAVDSMQLLKDAVFLDYQCYRNYLNSSCEEIFLKYQLAHFENWAGLMQQIYDNHLLVCAVDTDYLLLAIDNEEEKAGFIEAITVNCPQINALRRDNPRNPDELMEKLTVLLDELEALENKLPAVIGQSQANLDLYRDAMELTETSSMDNLRNYVAAISADAVDLNDFPIALPYPDWWYGDNNETFIYVWNKGDDGEEDDQNFVMPGSEIEMPPDQYLAKWADVSLEEYQAYLKTLEKFKIPAQAVLEEDGGYTAFFKFRSDDFALCWEENTVSLLTMEGSVCFAPPWYIIYTRSVSP